MSHRETSKQFNVKCLTRQFYLYIRDEVIGSLVKPIFWWCCISRFTLRSSFSAANGPLLHLFHL